MYFIVSTFVIMEVISGPKIAYAESSSTSLSPSDIGRSFLKYHERSVRHYESVVMNDLLHRFLPST
jgi:hypothetical protein